jgi:hypothetical protein
MPSLKLVKDNPAMKPLRPLRKHGATMWGRMMSEYAICDSGGLELLQLACEGMDGRKSIASKLRTTG